MSKKPPFVRKIVKERIEKLFAEAETAEKPLANRYMEHARTMAMRYKVPLPSYLKRRVCKGCRHYLTPGRNVRVRLQKNKVSYTCQDCGHIARIPFIKEKQQKATS